MIGEVIDTAWTLAWALLAWTAAAIAAACLLILGIAAGLRRSIRALRRERDNDNDYDTAA